MPGIGLDWHVQELEAGQGLPVIHELKK